MSEPLSIGPGTASKPLGGWARHDQLPGQATISFQPPKLWEWYIAAADAVDALGLPPDKLEEYVLALVRAARAWHECSMVSDTWFDMKTHGLDEALARSEALIAALAPFAHLGGEP